MDLTKERIETERLLLVPVSMQFKQEIFSEFREPVTLYMYPKAAEKIEETEAFIQTSVIQLRNGTNLQLVILHKEDLSFIGCAGLHNLNFTDPELGIWTRRPVHGNKYGQEAVKAIKEWADKHLTYTHLRYPVVEENIPSRKIAESLGGQIMRRYDKLMLSGRRYRVLEYWIYPPEAEYRTHFR
jgi:RimJ/RimL family protein N-acetyltransferase